MPASPQATTVAVVAFDRISPFHLSVPCIVFGEDRSVVGVPAARLWVCAAEPGPLRTTAGFRIDGLRGIALLARADIVIVPTWRDTGERPPAALLNALRAAHARGALVVGLCLGAFVLAEAGLLDGRTATTHWGWADEFTRRYPAVRLQRESLYVDDGDIVTSAGTAASLDCCLHVLRRLHGAEVANRVARRMVVAPHREGGQAQYVEQPLPPPVRGDRLQRVLAWALQHLDRPLSLDTLAERAAMSRRNFTRRFREATGTTVVQWLASHRVSRARRLLETTDDAVDTIAARTGFGSAVSLRQHFASAVKTSPTAYRRQFRGR